MSKMQPSQRLFTSLLKAFSLGKLRKGQTDSLHADTSGFGTTVIKLVKLVGAIPIITAVSDEKVANIQLGAKARCNCTGTIITFCSGTNE